VTIYNRGVPAFNMSSLDLGTAIFGAMTLFLIGAGLWVMDAGPGRGTSSMSGPSMSWTWPSW
jgi:hypothetical protein